jgi:hypothetical protein
MTFSVGQDYSLKGCSSAEPFSAYLGGVKENTYRFIITIKLFNKIRDKGRCPVKPYHEVAVSI